MPSESGDTTSGVGSSTEAGGGARKGCALVSPNTFVLRIIRVVDNYPFGPVNIRIASMAVPQ
jgi:hypothetical protein